MFCFANVPITDRKESQFHRALNNIFPRYPQQQNVVARTPRKPSQKNSSQAFDAA
jgi:hypothetical protein